MPNSVQESFKSIYDINDPKTVILQEYLLTQNNIELSILRLDEVHHEISGNKFYKLIYFLEEAAKSSHKKVITFGGAYSNHLAATAFSCKQAGIQCIGIVRGERPSVLSPTLSFCINQDMQLKYISRTEYKLISEKSFLKALEKLYGNHTLIPEGGFSETGVKGASLIPGYFKEKYSHICLAVGTATTFAGIINGIKNQTKMLGFDALKNRNDLEDRLQYLKADKDANYELIAAYHFGGYAKKTAELLQFMNDFYRKHTIPLDFVYTGKMMFGVYDLLSKNYFPNGSKILCIHTGGLQGNRSLSNGALIY
ncbi:MAG: pyridoxal-phosphate dependent enzyme [Ginsengibacter sp.]